MDVKITWETIGAAMVALGAASSFIAFIAYKIFQAYKNLEQKDKDRSDQIKAEDSRMRDELLHRYKEMYDLERLKSDKEISTLNEKIVQLSHEMEIVRARTREVQDENNKLRDLNLKYQEEKHKDNIIINTLQANIKSLTEQVEELRKKLNNKN